jgi:signal transduction histidine kinase
VEASGDRCPVYADPGQVEQILINLVVNARDAIQDHGEIVIATHAHELHADL